MKLVCGLGNPGAQYEGTRHNAGFLTLDAYAARLGVAFGGHKFEADVAQLDRGRERLLLLKPQTFMNVSGASVGAAARFFKLAPSDVLVVHDELDLPFGRIQLKVGGGTGGHNGLESIRESWGESAYARLRVGIGRPAGPGGGDRVVGYVLGRFPPDEAARLKDVLERAVDGIEAWVRHGPQRAMNLVNRKPDEAPQLGRGSSD